MIVDETEDIISELAVLLREKVRRNKVIYQIKSYCLFVVYFTTFRWMKV